MTLCVGIDQDGCGLASQSHNIGASLTCRARHSHSRWRLGHLVGTHNLNRYIFRVATASADRFLPYSGITYMVAVPGTGPGIGTGAGPAD